MVLPKEGHHQYKYTKRETGGHSWTAELECEARVSEVSPVEETCWPNMCPDVDLPGTFSKGSASGLTTINVWTTKAMLSHTAQTDCSIKRRLSKYTTMQMPQRSAANTESNTLVNT